jgi:hypothetical protein
VVCFIAALVMEAARASAAAPTASPSRPRVTFQASVEGRVDFVRYRFANPSSIDTAEPVPHAFEQRYDASNTWIALAAEYRLAGAEARTSISFAPRVTTTGSDIDSFFDPSGDVVTSGTTGDVTLGSIAIDQRFGLTTLRGWTLGVALSCRRSRADFLPALVVLTHTQPPSSSSTFTTDRETTTSQVIESGLAADRRWAMGSGWTVRARIALLPLTVARLRISLPDKHPPLDTTGQAVAFGARGDVSVERRIGPLVGGAGATLASAWSYGQTSAYRDRAAGVIVYVRSGS